MKQFYVYILTNASRTLYVGMTSDLERRIGEHKQKLIPGFTAKYNISQLVYYEVLPSVIEAITCEKKLKSWLRKKKVELIEQENPTWRDLSADWYPNP